MDAAINARVKQKLESYRLKFEAYLADTKTDRSKGVPARLSEAIEYSLNAGGKRLRPALCLAAAERCGCQMEYALPMALGLEMFHTGTLIHDDLPCMDLSECAAVRCSTWKRTMAPAILITCAK